MRFFDSLIKLQSPKLARNFIFLSIKWLERGCDQRAVKYKEKDPTPLAPCQERLSTKLYVNHASWPNPVCASAPLMYQRSRDSVNPTLPDRFRCRLDWRHWHQQIFNAAAQFHFWRVPDIVHRERDQLTRGLEFLLCRCFRRPQCFHRL